MKALKMISGLIVLYMFVFAFSAPFNGCVKTKVERDTINTAADGLVAYFPFNGNANDVSGYDHQVSFNNATLTTDRQNRPDKAFLFNGVSSYMRITNSYYLNPPKISLSIIIKPLGFHKGTCLANLILYKGFQDQDIYNVYFLRFDPVKYTGSNSCQGSNTPDTLHQNFIGSFAGNSADPTTPYVEKGKWYHLVYTYDGTTAKMYIDGVLASTRAGTNQYVSSANDIFLGRTNNPQFPYWFNGAVDELRIYNRALTADEVKTLKNSQD